MKLFGSMRLNRRTVNNLVLLVLLILLMIFFTWMNPRFFRPQLRQRGPAILPVVLTGCAMTFVINSGAIDLSVGGLMALSAVSFATFVTWGVGVWVALLMVVVIGLIVGALNAFIVARLSFCHHGHHGDLAYL